jgi:hypothetical protein
VSGDPDGTVNSWTTLLHVDQKVHALPNPRQAQSVQAARWRLTNFLLSRAPLNPPDSHAK